MLHGEKLFNFEEFERRELDIYIESEWVKAVSLLAKVIK